MKNLDIISDREWLRSMRNSKESPKVRPQSTQRISNKRWIKLMQNSVESPPIRPEIYKRESSSFLKLAFWLYASVAVFLGLSIVYESYLGFLTVPIVVTLYILERKHIL